MKGKTGIQILSKKIFGQFLITSQPQIFVNGEFIRKLRWNKKIFVPIEPRFQHHVEINFPYFQGMAARATMIVALHLGEIQHYRYNTPVIVTSAGNLSRIGKSRELHSGERKFKFCNSCGEVANTKQQFCISCGGEMNA